MPHGEFPQAFRNVGADPENKVVILTGTGDVFSGPQATGGTGMRSTPAQWDRVYWEGQAPADERGLPRDLLGQRPGAWQQRGTREQRGASRSRSSRTTPIDDTEALLRTVSARAAYLRTLLGRRVTQARQVVRQLLEGRLVCQPFEDAEARGYHFTATGTYRRLGVPEAVNVGGGPNGICHLVGQYLRFPLKGTAFRA